MSVDFFDRFDQALAAVTEQRRQERAALEAELQLAETVLGEVLKILDGYAVGLAGRLDAVTEHSAYTRELSIEERETGSFRKLIYARGDDGRITAYQLGLVGEELEAEKSILPRVSPLTLTKAMVQQQAEAFLLAVLAERPDLVPPPAVILAIDDGRGLAPAEGRRRAGARGKAPLVEACPRQHP